MNVHVFHNAFILNLIVHFDLTLLREIQTLDMKSCHCSVAAESPRTEAFCGSKYTP